MPRRRVVAVLGGTFDGLHAGHTALLAAAFQRATEVGIGLTTARYLRLHPKLGGRAIRSYATRRRTLVRYLQATYPRRRWWIRKLDDAFGGSVEPGVDRLIVSDETQSGGRRVNAERRKRGLPSLRVTVVPRILAYDGKPISSTRIRRGEIDGTGASTHPRPKKAPELATSRRKR